MELQEVIKKANQMILDYEREMLKKGLNHGMFWWIVGNLKIKKEVFLFFEKQGLPKPKIQYDIWKAGFWVGIKYILAIIYDNLCSLGKKYKK